ncbi:MAG: phage recombination protein Bet [Coriobacteriia bacterium]|nr:phage recombination protein Bet [Coriobacteriia bacterium]
MSTELANIIHQPLTSEVVKSYLVNGNGNVTDQEVAYFLALSEKQGLNPFLKDVYLIKYGEQPAQVITSKDAFMKRAESQETYSGYEAGVTVINLQGTMERREGSMVVQGEKLVGGWARVYRKDREKAAFDEVGIAEYSTGKSTWNKMPGTMIRKVALVHAMREAFPEQLQGMYTQEEMGSVIDLDPIAVEESSAPLRTQAQAQRDYKLMTECKVELAKIKGITEDEAGRELLSLANKPLQQMSDEDYKLYLAKSLEYIDKARENEIPFGKEEPQEQPALSTEEIQF